MYQGMVFIWERGGADTGRRRCMSGIVSGLREVSTAVVSQRRLGGEF